MAEQRTHTCKEGDHISWIASKYGLTHWETLWDANGELKSVRQNPNLLRPRDQLIIPSPDERQDDSGTGKEHIFQTEIYELFVRIRILKGDATALANSEYVLRILDETTEGKTDDKGQLEASIPLWAREGTITVRIPSSKNDDGSVQGESPVTWNFKIGALRPIDGTVSDEDSIAGVQQRLKNLRIECGAATGMLNDATKAAIKVFRRRYGLSQSARCDQEFRRKLIEVHDQPDSIVPPAKQDQKG